MAANAGGEQVWDGPGLARAEKINPSYVSRLLRLTLLAPEIVEAILDRRQPSELQLNALLKSFSTQWSRWAW